MTQAHDTPESVAALTPAVRALMVHKFGEEADLMFDIPSDAPQHARNAIAVRLAQAYAEVRAVAEAVNATAEAQAAEIARLSAALEAINVVRNSIVACQRVNFSEHVYPLVAALDAAGIEGMGYPKAVKYFGTMLERTNAAEARATQAEAALAASDADRQRMREALEEVVRLRLATDEGTLAKRADRMWQIATDALTTQPGAQDTATTDAAGTREGGHAA